MLQIFDAIDLLDVIDEKVGHTKPWVVLARNGNETKKLVVKLYNEGDNADRCVVNEVIGNLLARKFGFKVPDPFFVNISDDLLMKLKPSEQMQYSNSDSRYKFATEVQENISFLTMTNKKAITKRISIDTLYAFDNLIRNADRGQQKPNLLITANDAYLIDHEFVLKSEEIVDIDMDSFQIDDKFTKYHIFYQYLKKAHKSTKDHYFTEFCEYYRMLSFESLMPYFDQLHNEGFTNRKEEILFWLNKIKNNYVKFEGHLKASLQ